MADDSAKVGDSGPEDAAHIVRTTAALVENATDRLGDWVEGGANISQVEIGPTLDALAALSAASPLLRLLAAGHTPALSAVTDVIREQDALRGRAVREIADTMAGDLADVLGRPAGEPVPPWNMLLRIVRAMVVEDAEHALPEIPQSAVTELALAVGWSASDVRGVPGAWARLLREVRDQAQAPAPTPILSTSAVLYALGHDDGVNAAGEPLPASRILDAIRSTVAERNAAIDQAAAERARINLWAGQLAALLLGDNPAEDWGTPLGLDQLMTAVRQAVATLSTDVLDVATAIAYRNPDARDGQLPSRADWPSMMRDLATLRDQPANQALDLAAALGQPDVGELGASFDDLLDAVRELVEQQAENANQVAANPTPAGPPPPAETDPREDWSAFSENLFEQRPTPHQTYSVMPPPDDDGHGPDGQG